MLIYPAMDLLDGEVVRLRQGDFAHKTVYAQDPHQILAQWERKGVRQVHLVDLGASCGQNSGVALRTEILQRYAINFQVAGGVRSAEQLQYWLQCGAQRVVLGSYAFLSPQDVLELIDQYSASRLTIGCDVKWVDDDWQIAIEGWTEQTTLGIDEFLSWYQHVPELVFLITDISKDGTLQGINESLYHSLNQRYPQLRYLISGGINNQQDLSRARALGAYGCIVGRALYAGNISIEELVAC